MSDAVRQILDRLDALGFQTREGGLAPFGEPLPLVSAVAWDAQTAQLALVAESISESDRDQWRQLLFAGAGLRHHLAGDGPAAFGSPVILAVVEDKGQRLLRDLAEELAEDYMLFSRIDLNIVRRSHVRDPDLLDDALAPLLPRCRSMLGEEISKEEVKRFWNVLRGEVTAAAAGLDPIFAPYREAAGRDCSDVLIADSDQAASLPAPFPLRRLGLQNFRSIESADVHLGPVTVISGPNGGGKSSLLEAMELVWAGTSQRKPIGVGGAEYARHLPRNGAGDFQVTANGHKVTQVAESAKANLARNVLSHETVAALVSQSPEERYGELLTMTGLEIPDLKARTAALVDTSKREADATLKKVGLRPLPRRDSNGVRHLEDSFAGSFAERLPLTDELVGAERALLTASRDTYVLRNWPTDEHASAALIHADSVLEQILRGSALDGERIIGALDNASAKLEPLVAARRQAVTQLRPILDVGARLAREMGARPEPTSKRAASQPPIPRQIAARWLSHARALSEAASRFRRDAEGVEDHAWAARLSRYADALYSVASGVPVTELEEFGRIAETPAPPAQLDSGALYSGAGFASAPPDPSAIEPGLRELIQVLERQTRDLESLRRELQNHPARKWSGHRDEVLEVICRFELARAVRREGPILNASEQLVGDLLQGRLAPIVRELVGSIVRFEWYFEPLLVPDKGRKVVLGGLATSQPDLDARLVLNSAERTALGIAWFLALHLLQHEERRSVLVLDDPISPFDAPNQAGLISTLRAFVRLTRPQQFVIATHQDLVAGTIAGELTPTDGWPESVMRLRCQRDSSDRSVIRPEPELKRPRSIADEAEQLGLGEEPALL